MAAKGSIVPATPSPGAVWALHSILSGLVFFREGRASTVGLLSGGWTEALVPCREVRQGLFPIGAYLLTSPSPPPTPCQYAREVVT